MNSLLLSKPYIHSNCWKLLLSRNIRGTLPVEKELNLQMCAEFLKQAPPIMDICPASHVTVVSALQMKPNFSKLIEGETMNLEERSAIKIFTTKIISHHPTKKNSSVVNWFWWIANGQNFANMLRKLILTGSQLMKYCFRGGERLVQVNVHRQIINML